LADQLENAVAVWLRGPQNDDSRGLVRRIGADISKVEIQREQYTVLAPALFVHQRVHFTLKPLVKYGVALVTAGTKEVCCLSGEVLVDLAAHR